MKWDFKWVFNIPVEVEIYDDINVLGQIKRMKVGTGDFLIRNVNCALIDGAAINLLSAKDTKITLDARFDWINNGYILSENSVRDILSPTGSHYVKKGVGYDKSSGSNFINIPSSEYGEKITNNFFHKLWNQKLHEKGVYGQEKTGETNVTYMTFLITSLKISDDGGKTYKHPKEVHNKFNKNLAMFKAKEVDTYEV